MPISSLLRLTKVLAARISNPTLLSWVDNELNGYPPDTELPSYRGPISVAVHSDWTGPMGSYKRGMPLPSAVVPKQLRSDLFEAEFRQAVSELEPLALSDDMLHAAWNADAVALLNTMWDSGKLQRPLEFHGLVTAYRMISPALVRSILDTIRTRVLSVALELERIEPDAGEPGIQPSDPTAVTYAITNNIYGHGNAVAIDSPGARQKASSVTKGDLKSLLQAASEAGLPAEDVAELEAAIQADTTDGDTELGQPGARTRAFLGRLLLITGVGAGQVATGATGSVVAELIRAYYGLP